MTWLQVLRNGCDASTRAQSWVVLGIGAIGLVIGALL